MGMSRTGIVATAILLLLIGGAVWLYFWDIPAPSRHVEQELSDEGISR